ncbi:MAG TPA: hypothetical protein O0X68_00815 [Methanocorpusculum sp.]|nr:hypothetical protein [Methanocorpusculum sp.]
MAEKNSADIGVLAVNTLVVRLGSGYRVKADLTEANGPSPSMLITPSIVLP